MTEVLAWMIVFLGFLYGLAWVIHHPHWSVYLVVAAIPLDTMLSTTILGRTVSIADISVLTAILSVAIGLGSRRIEVGPIPIRFLRPYLAIAAGIIVLLIMTIGVRDVSPSSLARSVTRIEVVSLVILVPLVIDDCAKIRRVIILWSVMALFSSVIGLMQSTGMLPPILGKTSHIARHIGSYEMPGTRSIGLFSIYAYYGTFVIPVLSLLMLELMFGNKSLARRFLILLGAIIIFLAIVASQSRATWLGSLVVISLVLAYVLFHQLGPKASIVAILVIASLAVASVRILANSSASQNIVDAIVGMNESTVYSRIEQWRTALDLIRRNPLLGIGPHVFITITRNDLALEAILHNMFLNIFVEQGIPGGLLYVLFISLPLWHALTIRGNVLLDNGLAHTRVGLSAGILGAYVVSSFAGGLSLLSIPLSLGLLLAVMIVLVRGVSTRQAELAV